MGFFPESLISLILFFNRIINLSLLFFLGFHSHSVCHPNVVATYHYGILGVEASKPVTGRSGLTLHMTDSSKLGEFKMVIVQVSGVGLALVQGLGPGLRSRA